MDNIGMGVRHTFIQNMKYLRKRKGLTQEKLAEAIGMSTAYIGDMEARERFPSAETIDKISDALGVNPSKMFDEGGSPESIEDIFRETYANSLSDELKSRVVSAIDEVCQMIKAK